jgi:membrane protein
VGFSIYVSSFTNYSATYGSLGGVIVMLFFFYISGAVLLLGAEINAELHKVKLGRPEPSEEN